jgi:hypothetical protein
MTSPLLGDGTGGERERGRERRESAIEIEKKRDGVRERATARERREREVLFTTKKFSSASISSVLG